MSGAVVALGFVAMVLAPCAIALYSRVESAESEPVEIIPDATSSAVAPVFLVEPVPAATADAPVAAVETVADATPQELPVNTSPRVARATPLAGLARVSSLQEIADMASAEAKRAHTLAAQARVNALQEASRLASKRVEAAAKLAEAAERELVRATQAALQAEAAKARAQMAEAADPEGDYLPANHPSLDFPRSRVVNKKVA